MFIDDTIRCARNSYTQGRGGKAIDYIVVHYTGGKGSALDNARYFQSGPGNASAHYFIDGRGVVYQIIDDADTAWACGNFDFNQRSVSIEVCSDGEDFSEAEITELAEVVKLLMVRYGIPEGRVIRHHDCYDVAMNDAVGAGSWIDPRKACPAPYVDDDKWYALWERITGHKDVGDRDVIAESNFSVDVDGYWGTNTTLGLQMLFGTPMDGVVSHQWHGNEQGALTSGWEWDWTMEGSTLIRAMQAKLGCKADGLIGPDTIRALQRHYGTTVDGELWANSPCVRAMQEAINESTF